MEEIAEGFARGILKLIKWIVVDALIEFFLYWYGRITLLVLTLGQYPRGSKTIDDEGIITIAGVVSFVVTIALIMLINSSNAI